MNDLFRAIFGIPTNDQHGDRMDSKLPKDNRENNFWRNSGDDDDDDDEDDINMRRGPRGIFGVPIFSDPIEIHKHLDRMVDEMSKAFGIFGFSSGPSITWEGENNNSSYFNNEPEQKTQSLRDLYLKKPDSFSHNKPRRDDFNFDVNIRPGEVEPGASNGQISTQVSYPKVYSKSVFIQTVRKPDGSVETIKKVTDHEGNEKTIITQSNVNDPLPSPSSPPPAPESQPAPPNDISGISIFKKFFPF